MVAAVKTKRMCGKTRGLVRRRRFNGQTPLPPIVIWEPIRRRAIVQTAITAATTTKRRAVVVEATISIALTIIRIHFSTIRGQVRRFFFIIFSYVGIRVHI